MEKQSHQERDFNLVAKVLLGLSMITTGMTIFSSMLKFGYIEYANVTVASLIIEIVLDVLILIAGFAVFLKHRWGLIALTALFVIRMFATIPLDSTMYSYQLGGNMVHFFRDFGLFAIAMCFKKNGVSGWRSMLASEIQDANSTTEDSIGESVVEQNCIENTPDDMGETPNSIQEEEVLTQNTTRDDEADTIEEQSPIITIPAVENKKEIGTVETKKENSPKRRIKRSIAALIVLSLIFVGGGIGLVIYVNSQEYPKGIEGFSNKFKYCFSIPNNKLAKTYFEKYRKASNAGLEDLSIEFLEAAWFTKPKNTEILDSIGYAYFSLAFECEHNTLRNDYYQKAETSFLEALKNDPRNKHLTEQLVKIYYNTNQSSNAKRIAEQILFENPNDAFAIDIMCRIYYEKSDWNNLLRWGEKGYNIKSNKKYRIDCVYLYAKALYETGHIFDAMKYYAEAEKEDNSSFYHSEFQEIGGVPFYVLSLQVLNLDTKGRIIDSMENSISSKNSCLLAPQLRLQPYREGSYNLSVKFYQNGQLSTSKESPIGYSYATNIRIRGLEEQTIILEGWGGQYVGRWSKGNYKFEIWWEGEMLYSKVFNIY